MHGVFLAADLHLHCARPMCRVVRLFFLDALEAASTRQESHTSHAASCQTRQECRERVLPANNV